MGLVFNELIGVVLPDLHPGGVAGVFSGRSIASLSFFPCSWWEGDAGWSVWMAGIGARWLLATQAPLGAPLLYHEGTLQHSDPSTPEPLG